MLQLLQLRRLSGAPSSGHGAYPPTCARKLVSCKCLPQILDAAIMSRLQGFVLDFLIASAVSAVIVDHAPLLPQIIPTKWAGIAGLVRLGICT